MSNSSQKGSSDTGKRSPPKGEEIRMKKPHFFEILAEIEKPSELLPNFIASKGYIEKNFTFFTKPSRLTRRATCAHWKSSWRWRYVTRIVFRFCKWDTSEPQDDFFPSNLIVVVNNQQITLPPCPCPLDVTKYVHKSSRIPNRVSIAWKTHKDSTTKYAMAVCVAQGIASEELLEKLLRRDALNSDVTKEMVKKLIVGDSECRITNSLETSLICPIGLKLMKTPTRSLNCKHLKCFDAGTYLHLNELRSTWRCPLCSISAPFESLIVDEFFRDILTSSIRNEATTVELHEDGTWLPVTTTESETSEELGGVENGDVGLLI